MTRSTGPAYEQFKVAVARVKAYIGSEEREADDGTTEQKRVKARSVVFCRCQVTVLPAKEPA